MKSWEESAVNMRFAEIVSEDQNSNTHVDAGNIISALDLIKNRVIDNDLPPDIPIEFVLRAIQNTGIPGFSYADLITANEQEKAIKNIVKNITQDHVTFITNQRPSVSNSQEYNGSVDNPEQTVSNMAKSAMKRRQK
jgi:hypothetical protein